MSTVAIFRLVNLGHKTSFLVASQYSLKAPTTFFMFVRSYFLKFIFGIKLHVSDISSVHHQEYFTVHTHTHVPSWSCLQAVWHIPFLCVQWNTPDDGRRKCPKHVEFYSKKKKFEKILHLVSSIIRIYHDARSTERQMSYQYPTGKQYGETVFIELRKIELLTRRIWF